MGRRKENYRSKTKGAFFKKRSIALRRLRKAQTLRAANDQASALLGETQGDKTLAENPAQSGSSSSYPGSLLPALTPIEAQVTKKPAPTNTQQPKPPPLKNAPKAHRLGKRQSGRIHYLQEIEQERIRETQERETEKQIRKREIAAEKQRKEDERRLKIELAEYMDFIGSLSTQYLELPGRRQRMFRQSAVMLLNELLDEQEAQMS